MGTTKAVVDTNVIISAFKWGGNPREVFKRLENFEPLISPEQFIELQNDIGYPKLNLSAQDIESILNFVKEAFTLVQISGKLDIIKEDPADNVILETAIEHDADYIITGDKHLLKLKKYQNVKIVTPKEFLPITSARLTN